MARRTVKQLWNQWVTRLFRTRVKPAGNPRTGQQRGKTTPELERSQPLDSCFSADCNEAATEYSPTGSARMVYCRRHYQAALDQLDDRL